MAAGDNLGRLVSCPLEPAGRWIALRSAVRFPPDVIAVPLPREGTVYTATTIHVPVPGLVTPYTLVLAELGDTGVRILVRVTDAEAGSVAIGDAGSLQFRLVAVRSGVPDYGYAFRPASRARAEEAA